MEAGEFLNNQLDKESVKLDEVLKFLFSTSNNVLLKLLNGIFDENFEEDEVELTVSNNEFIEDDLGILRGDIFFDILNKHSNKVSYHIEFQTKNDSTMVVRMFEYGFKKGKEQLKGFKELKNTTEIRTIYFPRQKVIFFEENRNIKDKLEMRIVFPDNQEVNYKVEVMKYWEYTDEQLIEKKMYPLIPLQLFNLRKELEKAHIKNDINKIKELAQIARKLATKLARESKELFEQDEILGEDFHKMLLAVQNLIEYLNRNYLDDESIEEEVITMTRTLYDPEIERKGIEKGIEKGVELEKIKNAKSFLRLGVSEEVVAEGTGLTIDRIRELKKELHLN